MSESPLDEEQVSLQLGDIIEIEAPTDDRLDNKTFYIEYIDSKEIGIIADGIREIIKLNLKTGIQIYAEIKGEGVVSNQWFIAEKNSSGTYELTAKGKRDMENAINSANSGGDGGGEGGGGCG